MIPTVFFLGAGASAADGAPVMSKYIEAIERCFSHRTEWHPIKAALQEYNRSISHPGKYPALNDFLTYLDDHVVARKRIDGYDPLTIRFKLLRLMFGRLTEQERPRPRFTWGQHADVAPMPAFDENDNGGSVSVQPERARTPANHRLARLVADLGARAVISTNYDLIFDQALEDTGVRPDYSTGYSRTCEYRRQIRLLKIHGSVNWLVCSKCGSIGVWGDSYPTQALWAEERVYQLCPQCRCAEWLDTLVTPTRRRSQEHLALNPIWDTARTELRGAELIMFIGYSLPPEDEDVLRLLREGIDETARVLVVDPSSDTVAHREDVFGRSRVTPILRPLSTHLWDDPEVRGALEKFGLGRS